MAYLDAIDQNVDQVHLRKTAAILSQLPPCLNPFREILTRQTFPGKLSYRSLKEAYSDTEKGLNICVGKLVCECDTVSTL